MLRRTLLCLMLSWSSLQGEDKTSQAIPPTSPYESRLYIAQESAQISPEYLDEIVNWLSQRDGIPESRARIIVLRDLANRISEHGRHVEATSLLGQALSLARTLEEPDQLLPIYIEHGRSALSGGSRSRALSSLEAAYDLASKLDRPTEQTEAGLLLASILYRTGNWETPATILDTLIALPDADVLQVQLKRAEIFNGGSSPERIQRWSTVLELAEQESAHEVQARALNQLGHIYRLQGDTLGALAYFRQAETVSPNHRRNSVIWESYGKTLAAEGEPELALAALNSALEKVRGEEDLGHTAELHEAIASVHFDIGNHALAYASQKEASAIFKLGTAAPKFPSTALMPITPTRVNNEAANIAIVRNALREAELDRSRLRQRQALGITALAVLLAALLGLAYAYKRRNAQAMEISRDSAELRAENAHLLALRYQLNPHFLFNALNSLRSHFLEDSRSAEPLLLRLTAFCRQTLNRRSDGIQTLGEEIQMLRTFLDIEQSRWQENLAFEINDATDLADYPLPTFLLLPLIENAVKYGSQTSEAQIAISLDIQALSAESIQVTVVNSGHWIEPGNAPQQTSTGTGLTNLRQRLERYYPNRHQLALGPADSGVAATLTLQGAPHTPTL